MLTVFSGGASRDCQGFSRRNFLRIGTLGLAGLALPELCALRARAASERRHLTDKSVVFLFLNGGPSQFETFDPKMTAPAEIRSITGEVATSIPGVTFGASFPKLGALAQKLAVVRSFKTGNGGHDGGLSILSGGNPLQAAMAAVFARLAGAGHHRTGMPTNVFVSPQSVGVPKADSPFNYNGVFATGSLPSMYTAFHPTTEALNAAAGARRNNAAPSNYGGLLADMQLKLAPERLDDRRNLLRQLDSLRRDLDSGTLDQLDTYQQQAYEVLLNGVSKAFDLSKEDQRVVQRYDTSQIRTPEDLARRLTQTKAHSPVGLGKQLLLARRLCEAGCGFVTVGITGWDMHGNNGFGIQDGMAVLGPAVDHAVAAFLTDLEERGLSDKILLVVAGEMGRTPRIVSRAAGMDKTVTRVGRDHWANLAPLLLAGGGLKMGQVIGASDRTGGSPATEPVTLQHLLATIMHVLFDAGELRLVPSMPQDAARLVTEGQPIRELFS
jgi:hypothetical protein